MATFPVIISTSTPASVTVTGANYTYTQFKNSLGTFVYKVNRLYLYSPTGSQINQVMLFMKYDSNGQKSYINLTPTIDPFQQGNAYVLATKDDNLVLDGRDNLSFLLGPNVSLIMQIDADRLTMPDYLNSLAPTNYQQLQTAMGLTDLFSDYTDKLYVDGKTTFIQK